MKFAYFSHVWRKENMTPHERYELLWRELELADTLKFDYGFCVEHHFSPEESWMSSPSLFTAAAGMRTKHMRIGPMGYVVPLYNPLRLAEDIAILDQMLNGRFEMGLVPGINPSYFGPFGLDYDERKTPTLEYVEYLRAAYGENQPFSFKGEHYDTENAALSVQPIQRPHPPIWMQSRDPETLKFCAKNGLNTGYFLIYPREDAAPRYRKFLEDWQKAGWAHKPNIAYCTLVFVDETDEKAIDKALKQAARAYEGFLPPALPGESFEERVVRHSKKFDERGEGGATVIMANLFNPEYLIDNDLVFIGSPETVTRKLRKYAKDGVFNTFMGEFNFAELAEEDVMRSVKLFGEEVIPALADFEPY
jgi:alkanesulfonate monooxygenase SsuD/methylene tetrahydromethanopterin reductase-like flavin-dependent oxidoreductase (luciferase family)